MAKRKTNIRLKKKPMTPKKCYFCTEKKEPYYLDVEPLERFITERGKLVSRTRNGLCAMHQRRMTIAVKRARHLALLPFLVRG